MKSKVIVIVRGGLVERVYANSDIEVNVVDLDVSDFPDEGEQEAADARAAEVDELVKLDEWRQVW